MWVGRGEKEERCYADAPTTQRGWYALNPLNSSKRAQLEFCQPAWICTATRQAHRWRKACCWPVKRNWHVGYQGYSTTKHLRGP